MKPNIKNEDLKNVNGGVVTTLDDGDDCCPSCKSTNYTSSQISSGCDTKYHNVCNDCGHEWIS